MNEKKMEIQKSYPNSEQLNIKLVNQYFKIELNV